MENLCEYIYNNFELSDINRKKLRKIAVNSKNEKELIKNLKNEKIIPEKDLLFLMSEYYNLPLYSRLTIELKQNLTEYFDLAEVKKYKIIMIAQNKERINFAGLYPPDPFLVEKLRFRFKKQIKYFLMTAKEFIEAKKIIYNNYFSVNQNEILEELVQFKEIDSRDIDELKNIVEDAPIVKLLNKILTEAISLNASDIHLERKKEMFKVRYRIDGILKNYYQLPVNIAAAVISRIKIISGMDITIRHLPQDGKMEFKFQNINYDIRTSVIPTIYGEKAVLRLLLRNEKLLSVAELNFSEYNLKRFEKILNFNSGIILLSGPTGSGKTTTLFSILNQLSDEKNNIITIENPVEYKLDLLNQIEINQAQGLKFPLVLKSVLRQDPDIIMIGEIRDKETAEIAIRAAVTGHLVLSTIHTVDSVSAVNRLLDMGIAPYLISSTLNAVVAQRLLRKLCSDCREKLEINSNKLYPAKLDFNYAYQAEGCSQCNDGYSGRTVAAEILIINDKLRTLINKSSDRTQLKKAALASGMESLYDSALKKVKSGESTLNEMLRVIDLE